MARTATGLGCIHTPIDGFPEKTDETNLSSVGWIVCPVLVDCTNARLSQAWTEAACLDHGVLVQHDKRGRMGVAETLRVMQLLPSFYDRFW